MSNYDDDMTWEALSGRAGGGGRDLMSTLDRGHSLYDKWNSVRAKSDGTPRTNAEMAAYLSRDSSHPLGARTVTETMIADMDSAYARMREVQRFATNQSATPGDSYFSWMKFA